jgi:hypothetical protein
MSDIPMRALIQESMHPILGVSVESFKIIHVLCVVACSQHGGVVQLDHKHLKLNGKLTFISTELQREFSLKFY